jgi:hypothetical protein
MQQDEITVDFKEFLPSGRSIGDTAWRLRGPCRARHERAGRRDFRKQFSRGKKTIGLYPDGKALGHFPGRSALQARAPRILRWFSAFSVLWMDGIIVVVKVVLARRCVPWKVGFAEA